MSVCHQDPLYLSAQVQMSLTDHHGSRQSCQTLRAIHSSLSARTLLDLEQSDRWPAIDAFLFWLV